MQFGQNRREFITLIGGAAAAWPLAARAQQPERMREIGILSDFSDADERPLISAFSRAAREIGVRARRRGDRITILFAALHEFRLRHSKIADGRPLLGEERSCSGHHRHDRV
jgi:hypothetical protein